MKKDKIKIYLFEFMLLSVLFFALFTSININRYLLAIILTMYFIILKVVFKTKNKETIYNRQVLILLILFAFIYIGVFYALGLYFGFNKSRVLLSLWSFKTFIVPLSIIIVVTEYIRAILLSLNGKIRIKNKKYDFSKAIIYICMVLIDLLIYTGIYNLSNLQNFLMALGFVFFASISCNLLYTYISQRFNFKGLIIYRLMTTLYIYIIPIVPNVHLFFKSFLRMVYPFIIYLLLENTYAKTNLATSQKEKKKNAIGVGLVLILLTLMVMLISCQFTYGIIVIGSKSMSGTINMGDAVIYKRYNNESIKEGQVIMFNYNNIKTIHRVVKIANINGKLRYYTKGDANKKIDNDYRNQEDIIGVIKLKIKYIGKPTLWLKKSFN